MAKENTDKMRLKLLCRDVNVLLDVALFVMGKMSDIESTRESAIVKTKIDEALMWLDKYQDNIEGGLSHKSCRWNGASIN